MCESTFSTVTPATSSTSGLASSVWSQSSGGKTPQTSPTSSTSSTSTELDEGSTQLEPQADDHVDASASVAVEDNGNRLEKQGWGGSAASYAAGTPGSSYSHGCGTKRLREQTPISPQFHHAHDGSSARPSPVSDKHPQALSSDLGYPRRKKECLERSQHPRLDGQHTPGGPRSYRNQLSNSGIDEESVPCIRGDAPGGIFNTGMESSAVCCGKICGQESIERAEVEVAVNGSDGPEQDATETRPAQDAMDTCGALTHGDEDEVDFDGVEHEPLASGDHHGATSSSSGAGQGSSGKISGWVGGGESDAPLPAATCGNGDGRLNVPSSDNMVVADAKEDEASALRDAGVTGGEGFKELFPKLRRLKWKWGGLVTKLGSEYWICKAGVNTKSATVGVDKFAKKEDVVKYVRGVLRLADATLDSQLGQSGEERNQDTGGGSKDNKGNRDNRDNDETQGDGEKRPTSSEQGVPLSSMRKGRALQAALEALNPSNAPGVLQQRTAEFNQVLRFVTNSVAKASGGSLYLCGVPGTGKTQTMAHVQAKVQRMYSKVSDGALLQIGMQCGGLLVVQIRLHATCRLLQILSTGIAQMGY